jgi:hypothetical protein
MFDEQKMLKQCLCIHNLKPISVYLKQSLFKMNNAAEIDAVKLEIRDLKEQLHEAKRNGNVEMELAIHNRITATQSTLTALYNLSAPGGKSSSVLNFRSIPNEL